MSTRGSKPTPDFFAEPFRLFFPTGILIGIGGVALWPAYFGSLVITYPGTAHARLMIEGFMASFVIGFLGTAGPRMTSTSPFSRREVLTLFTFDLLAAGLHFGESHRAGDVLFVFLVSFFIFTIGRRRISTSGRHLGLGQLGQFICQSCKHRRQTFVPAGKLALLLASSAFSHRGKHRPREHWQTLCIYWCVRRNCFPCDPFTQ